MDKKEYRFSIKDRDVNAFFEKQSNKSLSLRLIVHDAIKKYGMEDVVESVFKERRKGVDADE